MAPKLSGIALAAIACAALARPAGALPPAERDWEVQVTFYAWASSLYADVEAGGVQTEIHESVFDLLPNIGWALMGGAEWRYKRGLMLVDVVGLQLVEDIDGGPKKFDFEREFPRRDIRGELEVGEFDVHTRLTQWIVDVKPGFRVLSLPMTKLLRSPEDPADRRRFDVDLLAGFRYWNVTNKTNVEVQPAELTVNGTRVELPRFPRLRDRLDLGDVEVPVKFLGKGIDGGKQETVDWVDPIVGLRIRADVTQRWSVFALGDVGGWNIGNASDLTWQGMLGSRFDFTDHWSIVGGFRALGVERDPALEDAILWGPQIGAVFRF